jgi:hypothetical protein
VKGSKSGQADGRYELLSETHDGAPLFRQVQRFKEKARFFHAGRVHLQVDGTRKNHLYYFEETRTKEHFWAIEPYTLKQVGIVLKKHRFPGDMCAARC